MLEQLYIKNVALIDEQTIEFSKGLNILSGETGAGKSIIIGSLSFVLGARANKDFIKKDKDFATVKALISLKSEDIKKEIINLGIHIEEDNLILIDRTYNKNGKNICKINGQPATLGMIKEICEKLIDIHGQHQHQSLLNPAKHILLLDRFCEDKLLKYKKELINLIKEYKNILSKISEFSMGKDREELIDFFSFQIEEIEKANLLEDEEEALTKERNILLKAEKIKNLYINTLELLSDDELSALDRLNICIGNVEDLAEIDTDKKILYDIIQDIYAKLEDLIQELKRANQNLEFDNFRLNEIEGRLVIIQKLKRKYGASIKEILKFKEDTKLKLDNLINSEQKLIKLSNEKEILEKKIKSNCIKISSIRKESAKELEIRIEKHLVELNMQNCKFKIDITQKDTFNQNGFDKVEFLISTNLGEDLKPLAKIASGGEMSRIMLSLKAVLSFADTIDTFIFDEIDSGISGRTAQKVAEKMVFLSRNNQIICITHLPQIAVMGDRHFLIQKQSDTTNTTTSIFKIDNEDIVKEIARMTGGATITEHTLFSAKEMLEQANTIKSQI